MDDGEGVQFSTDRMEPLDLLLSETEAHRNRDTGTQGQEHGGVRK